MRPSRLIDAVAASVLSALAASAVSLYASSQLFHGGAHVSAEDLRGLAGLSALSTLLLCLLVYAPGLLLLRRSRGGCEPATLFVAAAALPLNAPAAVILLAGWRAGMFSGLGEVSLFLSVFLVAGFVFGLLFVRGCRR